MNTALALDDSGANEPQDTPIPAAPTPLRRAPARRDVNMELERLQRAVAEREAQIDAMRVRLMEARGGEGRAFGALRGMRAEWEEMLAQTRAMDRILWGDKIPACFDPVETRIRVLTHVLHLNAQERLAWVARLSFLPTPQVERLWARLDALRRSRIGEIANLRVAGQQGSGKTWSLARYAMRVNGSPEVRPGCVPVLCLEAPATGVGLTQLFREGLALLGEPTLGSIDVIEQRFYVKAVERGVELLVIDEAGNFDVRRRRQALRRLTNVLKRPIVAVSAEEDWFGEDEHLARRFRPLHRFGPHTGADLAELLATLEGYLPFTGDSDLFTRERLVNGVPVKGPGAFILEKTGGLIDLVNTFVKEAAKIAIANGHDAIQMGDLESGWRSLGLTHGVDGEDR